LQATPILIDVPIQGMCQVGAYIWMASPQGYLIVVDAVTSIVTQQIDIPEFVRDNIIDMKTITAGLLAALYKSGVVIFVSARSPKSCCISPDHISKSFLHTLSPKHAIRQYQPKLSHITVTSPDLYATEVHTAIDDRITEMWCGCGKGVIEVIIPPDGDITPKSSLVLNTHQSSADIPPDASVVQLKSSWHTQSNATYMYALHGTESVISCWMVSEQPTLSTVIKLSPYVSSPGRETA